MFTTKSRYALRFMLYLASHPSFVSLSEVAQAEHISKKYLEQIVRLLIKAHLVESHRGKDGGYTLTKPANSIAIGEILRACEGSLEKASCEGCTKADVCSHDQTCASLPFWQELDHVTSDFVDSKMLADLMKA